VAVAEVVFGGRLVDGRTADPVGCRAATDDKPGCTMGAALRRLPTVAPLALSLILKDAGLDPAVVRLVRHRDPEFNDELCAAAIARSPAFDQYQSGQKTELFRGAEFPSCFVVDPSERDLHRPRRASGLRHVRVDASTSIAEGS